MTSYSLTEIRHGHFMPTFKVEGHNTHEEQKCL